MAKKNKKPVSKKRSVDYARSRPVFEPFQSEFRPVQERSTIDYAEGRSGAFTPIQPKSPSIVDHLRRIEPRDAAYVAAGALSAVVLVSLVRA